MSSPAAAPAAAPEVPTLNSNPLAEGAVPEPVKRRVVRRKVLKSKALPNPGKFDMLGNETKECVEVEINPHAKFDMNFPLTQTMEKQFAVGVSLSMHPEIQPLGHMVEVHSSLSTERQLLAARIDSKLNLSGRYHYDVTKQLQLKSQFYVSDPSMTSPAGYNFVCDADYKGQDWTGNAKLQKSGPMTIAGVNYLQSITPTISAGFEAMHNFSGRNPAGNTMLSFGARYKHMFDKKRQGNIYSVMYNPAQKLIIGNYARKLNAHTTLGASVQAMVGAGQESDSLASIGSCYMYNTFQFQGVIESTGRVAASLGKSLSPIMALTFCGEIQHWTNKSAVGMGIRIG